MCTDEGEAESLSQSTHIEDEEVEEESFLFKRLTVDILPFLSPKSSTMTSFSFPLLFPEVTAIVEFLLVIPPLDATLVGLRRAFASIRVDAFLTRSRSF